MTRRRRLLVGGLFIVLMGGGVVLFATRSTVHGPRSTASKSTYYCPMHPSYTADRPGDCPICNMKLVKREVTPHSTLRTPQSAKDICYLHNCPMVHGGKPCPMLVVSKAGEKVTCPICGTHIAEAAGGEKRKILYWTDPMIPNYRSDKPGKSPMGMDLIPVYEEAGGMGAESSAASPEGYTPILVSPQKQQLIGVKTSTVQRRSLTKTIRTVGRIAYDPELYQAQQEHLQAVRALREAQAAGAMPTVVEQAERLVESSRMRLRLLGLSQELITEVATWDSPDQSLLLADPGSHVWVYASIYEFELPWVAVGQPIAVELPAVPGKTLAGIVRAIDPVLDPTTRAARIRAVLTNPEGLLKPEMFVNVSIAVPLGDVLAIPEEAVFQTGMRQIVFVDKGQGIFEPRDVMVGAKADGSYEIKQGVSEGERVVTSGNFLIDSESRLKAALEGLR